MGRIVSSVLLILVAVTTTVWAQDLATVEQQTETLRARLRDVVDKEAQLQERARQIDEELEPENIERCVSRALPGKRFGVISVDAHSTGALNNVKYGVGIARRGWVRRGEVLNALGVKAFQKAVRPI